MAYVDRDGNGHIVGIYNSEQHPGQEFVDGATLYVDPAQAAKELKDRQDADAAKVDNKVNAVAGMTPAQARSWVASNVTNFADAKDLLGTMLAMLTVLARRL